MASLPPSPFSFADVQSAETLVVAPRSQAPVAAASGPFDSGEYSALPPGEAAASLNPQSSGAAVGICESSPTERRPNGSPAPGKELCGAGDLEALFDIGGTPCGVRKLNLPRFKLDEERFMADIEEVPLFLRQA